MTCDIFIRTYPGDDGYHVHCMRSIGKFCSGFRNVTVLKKENAGPKEGYLDQQVDKLHADVHTGCSGISAAEFILVTDSDTLFTGPVTPSSFFRDGKPVWMYTPLKAEMRQHQGVSRWIEVMREFIGKEPPHEFMRRQPFVFPAWLLKEFREFCLRKHGKTIREYIFSKGVFSEYNALGFYAWTYHRDTLHWMNSEQECPVPLVRQFWSHDPVESNLGEIERILA